METIVEKDGLKLRKLAELRTSTAKEYQEAMLGRVEYFKQQNLQKSQFNSIVQNTVVKGVSTLLNLKVQVDKALGEQNLKKVQNFLESILLFGL